MITLTTEQAQQIEEALMVASAPLAVDRQTVLKAVATIRAARAQEQAEQALQKLLDFHQSIEHDGHWSDCSTHNEPAYPNGECDCGGYPAEQEPVAWRVRGYNQFKTGNPAPWRYVDGTDKPTVNIPDCCDFEPLYAAPVQQAEPMTDTELINANCRYTTQLMTEQSGEAADMVREQVLNYERLNALREGEQNKAENDYFNARPENDTPTLRKMFCQGFERGFHKGIKYAASVEPVKQEPVAWRWPTHNGYAYAETHFDDEGGEPLYAAPVRTKDLTDDEIAKITGHRKVGGTWPVAVLVGLSLVAADREKNK